MSPHKYARSLLKLTSSENRVRILAVWLVAGMLFGFLGFRIASESNRRQSTERLEVALGERTRSFTRELEASVNVVRSTAALFQSRLDVTRQEFARFARAELTTQETAAHALEWIPLVNSRQRDDHVQRARQEGLDDYEITERTDGEMVPAAERDEYSPVYYIEPSEGNESVLGYDLMSHPARKMAVQQALATGRLTLSDPIELIHSPRVMGFMAMVPVFEPGRDGSGAVRGLVLGVFQFGEIASDSFAVGRPDGADSIRLELTTSGQEPESSILYTSHPMSPESPLYWSGMRTIEFGGQEWQLAGRTLNLDHHDHGAWFPYWVAAGVFLLSQCVFGVGAIGTERIRVRAVTKQVRLLRSVLRSVNDGVMVANPRGQVVMANRMAQELLGGDFDDIPPESWSEHFGVYLPDTVTLYPPDRLPLARAIRGETTKETEVFIRNEIAPHGTWLSVNGTPLLDEDDSIGGGVVVFRDISARKIAEAANQQIELAVQVQSRFYSETSRAIPGFDVEAAVFSADATCGDYFDFVEMPGLTTGLVVGDVCGHGISAALVMAETRALLRSAVKGAINPGKAFNFINELLARDLEDHRYVTMLLARLDPETGNLCYTNAGHTPGFIIDSSGNPRCSLGPSGLPLGMFAGSDYGHGQEAELRPGELLVLSTDGVAETESPCGTPFSEERIISVVAEHRDEPARQIVLEVERAIREFSGSMPQRDDVTIMICKRDIALETRIPHRRTSVESRWDYEEISPYVSSPRAGSSGGVGTSLLRTRREE